MPDLSITRIAVSLIESETARVVIPFEHRSARSIDYKSFSNNLFG